MGVYYNYILDDPPLSLAMKSFIYHFPSDTGQWYQGTLIYKNLNFSSSSIKEKPQYLYTHDRGLLPTFGNCLGGCSLSNWLITALHLIFTSTLNISRFGGLLCFEGETVH